MFSKKARWICASERFFNPAQEISSEKIESSGQDALCMLARGSVKLPKHVKQCRIRISADDFFLLYINGQFIACGPASCYPSEQYVLQLDVSKYVRSGLNLLAVQVYYDGRLSPSRLSGNNRQGFICELEADGVILACSGDKFRCFCPAGAGYTRVDGLTVESLDLRSFPKDWMQPKFDDSGWSKPIVKRSADYHYVLQPISPDMYIDFNVQPDAEGVYDLEDDYTGVPLVKAQGPEGSYIDLYRLKEDCPDKERIGRLYPSGNSEIAFSLPQRLRRISVECENGASLSELGVRVFRFSESDSALSLKTVSSDLINCLKRWKSAVLDDSASAFDAQEHGADRFVSALARSYLSGELGHYAMQLKNMALSQSQVKTLLYGDPCSLKHEDRIGSLLFVHHAYLFSLHCDDRELLEELRQASLGVLRAFATYARRDGLLESSDENGEKRCLCAFNAVYAGALLSYDKLCKQLSVESGVRPDAVKDAFNAVFFDEPIGLYRDVQCDSEASLSDNIYPVYFELLPCGSAYSGAALLKQASQQRDEYYRLKALCLCGEYDEASRQVCSSDLSSPEAAVCVLIEDILSINPSVINGQAWSSHLSGEYGNVSVRVRAFQHRALYSRQDGLATLKL